MSSAEPPSEIKACLLDTNSSLNKPYAKVNYRTCKQYENCPQNQVTNNKWVDYEKPAKTYLTSTAILLISKCQLTFGQIERNCSKLTSATSLKKENLVIVRNITATLNVQNLSNQVMTLLNLCL